MMETHIRFSSESMTLTKTVKLTGGNVDGSGLRCNGTFDPSTTLSDADHALSPLSDVAEQV